MTDTPLTFRIFVSSTFGDFKIERGELQKRVFKPLRELATSYGCRFQAVDLRWGVSEEAGLDQQTMKICLGEIERCKKVSPRPNFIILLGNRYGWRPLPYEIPDYEYRQIIQLVPPEEKHLVEEWYHRDENSIPVMYLLQPRREEYEDYKNWEPLERRLHETLEKAARTAKLEENALAKYCASATEQEIVNGALHVLDADNHVFCYFRTIEGLPHDEHAAGFVDLTPEGKFDEASAKMLETLKGKLEERLPHHVRRFKSRWDGKAPTVEHLDGLCQQVYKDLEGIILHEIQMQTEGLDALDAEIEAHEKFGSDRARDFTGRENALQAIAKYLGSEDDHPFVIIGESGCGKSALMAKAAQQAAEKGSNDLVMQIAMNLRSLREGKSPQASSAGNPEILSRYIGATPESITGRGLLESLCRQITHTYDQDESSIPGSYKELSRDFTNRLAFAKEGRPIFIFLDALDQLSTSDNAHTLAWLPTKLPKNVKVVVSILPGDVQKSLTTRIPMENFFELEPMSVEEGEQALEAWLERDQRILQSDQRQCVLDGFKAKGLPLYLKLAYEEARRWKSYDSPPELGADILGMIEKMFARLSMENNHGALLVSKCLGYLAAARMGLSEDELLDVLALDDEVFGNIQENSRKHGHELSERVLPVILWSRFYYDLEPYLSLRMVDNSRLLSFFHRQVGEAASKVYLTPDVKTRTHAALARYFASKALQVEKKPNLRKLSELPFQQTGGELWPELNNTLCDLSFIETKCAAGRTYDLVTDYERLGAGRNVTGAPYVTALANQGTRRICCPYCQGTSDLELNQVGTVVYCPYCGNALNVNPFMLNSQFKKTEGRKVRTQHVETRCPHLARETLQFADFIFEQAHILNAYPELCLQQALNQPDRSAPAKAALKVMHSIGDKRTWLRWMNKPEQRSSCMMTLDEHRGYVTACAFSPDGTLLISTGDDKTLRVWVTATGEQRSVMRGHTDVTRCCAFSPNANLVVSGSADNTLKIWDVSSGMEQATLSGHGYWVHSCTFSPDGSQVLSIGERGGLIIWDALSGKKQVEYRDIGDFVSLAYSENETTITLGNKVPPAESGSIIQSISSLGGKRALSPDGKLVASGAMDGTIKIWDTTTKKEYASLVGHKLHGRASGIQGDAEQVLCCAFSPDGKYLASSSFDKTVKVWDVETRKELATLRGHTEWVKHCCFSPDGTLIASASGDGTIKIWVLADAIQYSQSDGMQPASHSDQALACDFSPDGETIITASLDFTLKLWQTSTGSLLKNMEGHSEGVTTCAFSPDGRHILSGSNDRSLCMWDVENGEQTGRFEGFEGPVRCCTFHTNGKFLAAAGPGGFGEGGRIILLDSSTLEKIIEFETPPLLFQCAIQPDGLKIASAGGGGAIYLWDLEDVFNSQQGRSVLAPIVLEGHDIDFELGDFFTGEPTGIYCLAFSPDGNFLLSGGSDNTLILWDVNSGTSVRAFSGHKGWVRTCSFSADGRQFVSAGGDNTMRLWDLASGETIGMFFASGIISCARISPVDNTFCCTDVGGALHILRLESGTPVGYEVEIDEDIQDDLEPRQTLYQEFPMRLVESELEKAILEEALVYRSSALTGHLDAISCVGFSADGKWIISGSDDHSVRIWDLESTEELHCFSESQDPILAVNISPDKHEVTAISQNAVNTNIFVWDIEKGYLVKWLQGDHPARAAALNQEGDLALVVYNKTLILWNTTKNQILTRLTGELDSVIVIALSPDGKFAALGADDNAFRIWDLDNAAEIAWITCPDPLKAVAFTAGGRQAIYASEQGSVWVYDMEDKDTVMAFQGSSSPLTALAVTPEGQQLIIAGRDGEVMIWNLENGELLHTEYMDGSFSTCAVFSEGKFIVLGDKRGTIHLLTKGSTPGEKLEVTYASQPEPEDEYDIPLQLIAALKSEDEGTRLGAIPSLEEYKDEHTADAIGKLFEYNDINIRDAAITALVRIRTRHAAAVILQAAKFRYEGMESLIAVALGMMGGVIIAEPLISALEDEDLAVRGLASRLLKINIKMGGGLEKFVNDGYQHRDEYTCQKVIDFLRRHGYS